MTSTSTGGYPPSSTGSTGGTPVPGPPVVLLFGAAAVALVARQRRIKTTG